MPGMERDICKNRHGGNASSFLANQHVAAHKPNQRARIYSSLDEQGPATCEELSARLGIRYTSCSARLAELKAERWVTNSGATRKTSGGEDAAVIRRLTAEEREALLHPRRGYQNRQGVLFV